MIAKPTEAICNIEGQYGFYLEEEKLHPHQRRSDFRMAPEVLEHYVQQYIEAQAGGEALYRFGKKL